MLYVIIILFTLAAVAGVIILKNWLTGGTTSKAVIYGHGFFAAVGLVLLLVHYFKNGVESLRASIILFVIAALVGFYMFFKDLRGKMSPNWLAITHGLVGATALVLIVLMVI